jgi:hypothetical protein
MGTYLFCTDAARYAPEDVHGTAATWSCSSTTRAGDRILVYVLGLGIGYEWQAVSDAEPDVEWKYVCQVTRVQVCKPTISLADIRQAVSRDEWAPPHLGFRGYRSIRIPEGVAERLISLRTEHALTDGKRPKPGSGYDERLFARLYLQWARDQGLSDAVAREMLKKKLQAPEIALAPEELRRIRDRGAKLKVEPRASTALERLEQPAVPVAPKDPFIRCPWGCGAHLRHPERHRKRCPKLVRRARVGAGGSRRTATGGRSVILARPDRPQPPRNPEAMSRARRDIDWWREQS